MEHATKKRNLAAWKRFSHTFLNVTAKQQIPIGEIRRLCEKGHIHDALQWTERRGQCVRRDDVYWLLQACSQNKDLALARRIQLLMDISGLYKAAVLADHLIRLFTLCGSLQDAKHTFARVPNPTVFTWNAVISAHIQLFEPFAGLLFFSDMQRKGIEPNRVTFLWILKACSSLHSLSCSWRAHDHIICNGLESDAIVANMLINTYSKCRSVHEARCVFDKLHYQRDVISWSAMISGYVQHGLGLIALELYTKMQEEGFQPENTTYSSILKACGSIGALHQGRHIHDQVSRQGLLSDVIIGGTLIDMYIKCGKVKEARLVFDSLLDPDEVSWSTMIAGYAQHGYGFPALELFGDMQRRNIKVDRATYLCVLKACALVGATDEGRLAHKELIKHCLDSDVVVKNALIDMYVCCASLEDACKVFNTLSNPDIASWGAIVSGYAEFGRGILVEQSLKRMRSQGFKPDSMIFMSILSACSHAGLLDEGCRYFNCMSESYAVAPSIEHYNCMVDLFCRAGRLDEAQTLLLSMPALPDIVGETSFVTGCRIYSDKQTVRHPLDGVLGVHPTKGAPVGELALDNFVDACKKGDLERREAEDEPRQSLDQDGH